MTADSGQRKTEVFRELSAHECQARLRQSSIGRVAVCTPDGPVIIPVNYVIHDEAVVFRTAPYSMLAGHAWDHVAFEIDEIDDGMRRGWSVLVVGKASAIEDADEIADSQLRSKLTPWAPGSREMFITITPKQVTGREVAA